MNSNNYPKQKTSKAPIVTLIIAIAMLAVSVIMHFAAESTFGIYIGDIIGFAVLAVCAIILYFVNLKSYGWAIAGAFCISGIIASLVDSPDVLEIAQGSFLALVCFTTLFIKNKNIKIKSYGWAIAGTFCMFGLIDAIINEFENLIIAVPATIICFVILFIKNIK